MNKLTRNIIILVVVLAALAGAFWWIINAQPKEEEEEDSPQTETITVYDVTEEDITGILIETADRTLNFTKHADVWNLEGYDQNDISQTKVKSLASSISSITTSTKVEDSIENCGLDTPQITVKVTLLSGNTDVIKIGDLSPVLDQYFCTVNDGEIYTMYSFKVDDILKEASYYTDFSRLELVGEEIYDIKVERGGKTTMHLTQKQQADDYMSSWQITEPFKNTYSAIDEMVTQEFLDPLSGLSVNILAANDADTGLSNPKAVVTILSAPISEEDGSRGETVTTVLKIGNTKADVTYVEYNGAAYEVDSSSVDFIDTSEFLIVSKLVGLVPIQSLYTMTVESGEQKYVFEVSHSNIGADDDEMTFKIDGKEAGEDKSKTMYQEVIGLSSEGIYGGEALGETIAKVTYSSQDGERVIEFKSINDLTASFTVNGITEFTVKKSSVASMIEKVAEFANAPV